jgi:two-component system, LuxR family, response regulator FixJ
MTSPVIFVVDDDAFVRAAVRRLLLSIRLPVRLFASAEQFLADTDHGAPGCLILDVRLPGMDGLQLQQRLAERDWPLPVIFISAHDDDGASRDAAMRRGAVAYLRKPFDRNQLLTSVRGALGRCDA